MKVHTHKSLGALFEYEVYPRLLPEISEDTEHAHPYEKVIRAARLESIVRLLTHKWHLRA